MRVQHPRATDLFSRDPPSQATVSGARYAIDGEGYVDPGEDAEAVVAAFSAAYDVEYDNGEVVVDSDDEDDEDDDGGLEEGDVVMKEDTVPEKVTCAGPNGEGNCSRPVESEGDRCWQHVEE